MTGCAGVFDLEHVEPPLPLEYRVSGKAISQVVTNNVQREPQIEVMPSDIAWHVILDDGRSSVVDQRDDGTLTFLRASDTQKYRLYTTDLGYHLEVDSDAPSPILAAAVWGRFDVEAPRPGTALQYQLTSVPTTGGARVNTTGQWTTSAAVPPGTARIEWATAAPLAASGLGLLSAARNDRAYWIFEQDQGEYSATVGYRSDDIEMTQGEATTISGAYAPANRDQCVAVHAPRADEIERLAAILGAPTSTFIGFWFVTSVATPELSPAVGYAVATSAGYTNVAGVNAQIANPYAGHSLLLQMAVGQQRPIMVDGTSTPLSRINATQHFVVPSTTCSTPSTITQSVAVATNMALDGIALADDDTMIDADRTRSLPLTWEHSAGPFDTHRVDLYRVFASGTTTVSELVGRWTTVDSSVEIDPALIDPAETYFLFIVTETGVPNASAGDNTISYPYAYSYVSSGSFRIP